MRLSLMRRRTGALARVELVSDSSRRAAPRRAAAIIHRGDASRDALLERRAFLSVVLFCKRRVRVSAMRARVLSRPLSTAAPAAKEANATANANAPQESVTSAFNSSIFNIQLNNAASITHVSVPSATAQQAALTGTRIGFQLSALRSTHCSSGRWCAHSARQRRAGVNQRVRREAERAHSRREARERERVGHAHADAANAQRRLASVHEHVLYSYCTI